MTAQATKTILDRPTDREVVFSRTLQAPCANVWRAWTDPKRLEKWFGPDGFTLTTHEMNFKQDGFWKFTMHGPDGTDYKNKVLYLEIDEPHRLVYKQAGEEETEDINFLTTITFEALSDHETKLIMHMQFATAKELQFVTENYGAIEGGFQNMERFADYVETH
jgi:uncharacterized protein YndB with AHSA1/START domain